MSKPDIVTRLRESDGGYFMRKMFTEAADEIERLRNERNAFKAKRDQLISISNKLKRERDEARREVCNMKSLNFDRRISPEAYAALNKWDCFKGETS